MQRTLMMVSLVVPGLMLATDLHSEDTLQQDPISIMGNRGLPKTMFIAPWKRLGGPLAGGELRSTLDQEPGPVEREVFHRELELYGAGFSID